jgi:hypothetical protein
MPNTIQKQCTETGSVGLRSDLDPESGLGSFAQRTLKLLLSELFSSVKVSG